MSTLNSIPPELAERLGLIHEPGMLGSFTRNRIPWALPNGTRMVKVDSEPGDGHPDGSTCTVLGSIGGSQERGDWGYFVTWDEHPTVACFAIHWKLRAA